MSIGDCGLTIDRLLGVRITHTVDHHVLCSRTRLGGERGRTMHETSSTTGGVILCGGRSRRMGEPKEWLDCAGEPLLTRVAKIVASTVAPVIVAARRGQSLPPLPPGVETVFDQQDDQGPLMGLLVGMERLAHTCESIFITGCDHPLISPQVIRFLIDCQSDAYDVVIPIDNEQVHPLMAVYRTSTLVPLREQLTRGERSVRVFAAHCRPRYLPSSELRAVDPDLLCLRNVNDPTNFAHVASILGGRRPNPSR